MITLWLRLAVVVWLIGGAGPVTAPSRVALRGVNFAGADFSGQKLPGRPGWDYIYPVPDQLDWAAASGFTVIRLPVLWGRLQPVLMTSLDAAELGRLQAFVTDATKRQLAVVIDIHDYGAYRGQMVGSTAVPDTAFADLWRRIAIVFAPNHTVLFGLMNEPHDRPASPWATSLQAAIHAIRTTGAVNRILVSGVGWDNARNFVSGAGYGTPNATALDALVDPGHALLFEVHQYLDHDFSGTHSDCRSPTQAVALLQPFTDWLKAKHHQGFLGEFGAAPTPECLAALSAMLRLMNDHRDVWAGWTYWAAGAWWGPNYPFSVEPQGGVDRPQMSVLKAAGRTAPPP